MNKLTANRCKQRITELQFKRDNQGMSNQMYDYLEALEIALPVLEQQERGEWIEWKGGLVPPVTGLVEVRYRNGREQKGCKAGDFSWSLGLGGLTIIAYRIIPEQPTNQNGEQ